MAIGAIRQYMARLLRKIQSTVDFKSLLLMLLVNQKMWTRTAIVLASTMKFKREPSFAPYTTVISVLTRKEQFAGPSQWSEPWRDTLTRRLTAIPLPLPMRLRSVIRIITHRDVRLLLTEMSAIVAK